MRIAVVGAGAVGGYYGARLAQAGHDVSVVARGANLEAIRANGLAVRSPLGNITVRVHAEQDPARIGPADLVLLAVKTYSNAEALPALQPLVGPRSMVLTLQNGVDSADELHLCVGADPVLAGATYIITTLVAPGVVQHTGSIRRIVFGEAFGERVLTARVQDVQRVLAGAGIQAEAVADSRVPIWEKFIFLAPFAGLTAAARLPLGPLWAVPAFRDVFDLAMAEVEAVARAEGVAVAADVRAQKIRYLDESPSTSRSSMMMDLLAGKPLEVEALLGSAVRRGRAAGLPVPVMETLYAVLKPLGSGAIPPITET
jgi:2-dehydropantoate 2-reductase